MKRISMINEHLWSGIIHRSESGDERHEDLVFDVIRDPIDGISAVVKRTDKGSLWSYINEKGQRITRDWFGFADDFQEGFGCVLKDGKYNWIDRNGKYLLKTWVDYGWNFKSGFAKFNKNNKFNFIDKNGNVLLKNGFFLVYNFKDGCARVENEDTEYNFIDTTGKLISNKWFEVADDFCNGCAVVKNLDKYNYINNKGEIISKEWFDMVYHFNEKGYGEIIKNEKYYLIDKNGKLYPETTKNRELYEHLWSGIIHRSETGEERNEDLFCSTKEDIRRKIQEIIDKTHPSKGDTIDLNHLIVSGVEDMSDLFYDYKMNIDFTDYNFNISKWDVSSVTNMECMFWGCENFNSDLSKWNVSKVTDMSCVFCKCKNFNSDLSNWDVSNVTDMYCMFFGCARFNCDLSNWNVSNVTDMQNMFNGCSSLEKIPDWYHD